MVSCRTRRWKANRNLWNTVIYKYKVSIHIVSKKETLDVISEAPIKVKISNYEFIAYFFQNKAFIEDMTYHYLP